MGGDYRAVHAYEMSMTSSDFEKTTVDELLEWANGLGICEFESYTSKVLGDGIRAKGGRDVELYLHFGTYNESATHGGMRHVTVWSDDKRNGGYHGRVCGGVSWVMIEHETVSAAKRLGLYGGQMRLF